jgi:hypothetical protein
MGERDFHLRYRMARDYADEQAEKLRRGEHIQNWTHERDWRAGEPEPRKITLVGAAWVAHAYDIAAEDAQLLASRDRLWRSVVEDCQQKADRYRKQSAL